MRAPDPRIPAFAFLLVVAILLLTLGACTARIPNSADAICEGTLAMRHDLARSLVDDGGDRSLVTGQRLLASLHRACQD